MANSSGDARVHTEQFERQHRPLPSNWFRVIEFRNQDGNDRRITHLAQ